MNKSNHKKYNRRIQNNRLEIGIACLTGEREEAYQMILSNIYHRHISFKLIDLVISNRRACSKDLDNRR